MKHILVLCVLIAFYVSPAFAEDASVKIYDISDPGNKLAIDVIPINSAELSRFFLNVNINDDDLVGFIVAIRNLTGTTYFLDLNDSYYINCFGEKRVPLTPMQVEYEMLYRTDVVKGAGSYFYNGRKGVTADMFSGHPFLGIFKSYDPLASHEITPDGNLSGTIFFDYTDNLIYDSRPDPDTGRNKEIYVKPARWPVKNTILYLDFNSADGGGLVVKGVLDDLIGEASIEALMENHARVPVKKIYIGDLPKE